MVVEKIAGGAVAEWRVVVEKRNHSHLFDGRKNKYRSTVHVPSRGTYVRTKVYGYMYSSTTQIFSHVVLDVVLVLCVIADSLQRFVQLRLAIKASIPRVCHILWYLTLLCRHFVQRNANWSGDVSGKLYLLLMDGVGDAENCSGSGRKSTMDKSCYDGGVHTTRECNEICRWRWRLGVSKSFNTGNESWEIHEWWASAANITFFANNSKVNWGIWYLSVTLR